MRRGLGAWRCRGAGHFLFDDPRAKKQEKENKGQKNNPKKQPTDRLSFF
jgi:hypothetical protein